MPKRICSDLIYLSLAMLEFLDIDFGDISKSESDRYKNDSRRCGKFCKINPVLGEPPSIGDRAPCPFSTSKLYNSRKKNKNRKRLALLYVISNERFGFFQFDFEKKEEN